jgi:hypothetical protein
MVTKFKGGSSYNQYAAASAKKSMQWLYYKNIILV